MLEHLTVLANSLVSLGPVRAEWSFPQSKTGKTGRVPADLGDTYMGHSISHGHKVKTFFFQFYFSLKSLDNVKE